MKKKKQNEDDTERLKKGAEDAVQKSQPDAELPQCFKTELRLSLYKRNGGHRLYRFHSEDILVQEMRVRTTLKSRGPRHNACFMHKRLEYESHKNPRAEGRHGN